MLVIQRSLRKSAPLVESRERPNQQSRRCLTCVSKSKVAASEEQRGGTNDLAYSDDAGRIFLQGKPILLQHRESSKKQISYKKNSEKSYVSKTTNYETFSAVSSENIVGRRPSSEARKRTPRNSTIEGEYQKTVYHKRKHKVRTPLLMSTMSLPNENLSALTSKETLQAHMSREEAQATLQRLLATRTQSPSTSTNTQIHSASHQHATTEKSTYLQESYDYLYQRHLQNLNTVIHQSQQQGTNDSSQISQRQKKKVDIHQNCCRGEACHSNRQGFHDSVTANHGHSPCEIEGDKCQGLCQYLRKSDKLFAQQTCGVVGSYLQKEIDGNCNTLSNTNAEPNSFRASCDNVSKHKSCMSYGNFDASCSGMGDQSLRNSEEEATDPHSPTIEERKRNGGFICINVSNQFQDIYLEEAEPAITKPMITLNHVSESFSGERQDVSVIRSHSRSPSPMLEVPPAADIHHETLRPPLH